jgi:toxin ParE1/3/4
MAQNPNDAKPFRLKPAALRDLEGIWDFTADRWSPDQADAYVSGLYAAFERLAQSPHIVAERTEYKPPVRIYRYEAHIVVFRQESDHLAIVRIRHGHEDWASDPTQE